MNETSAIARSTSSGADAVVLFFIKACIAGFIVTACVVFSADWIIESIEHSVARTISSLQPGAVGGRRFWSKLEEELDRAAAPGSDLSAEKKEKLINNIRTIAARWRPLFEALRDEKEKRGGAGSQADH